ncbi:MAG: helix-turn-helix transcriptional regulator [Acidobacteria bacterium]|nr:helix-turn-helix transcriptional regulator [Acidobacteriota bacterium]
MHTGTPASTPPGPVLTGLGQALRWLRERQARKQYQVASAAGITKGMLSAYETGRQRPSLETLDKLLETLGCDLNDLHNALQIVNGRPEQMKGWRGGLGAFPGDTTTPATPTPTPIPAWPGLPGRPDEAAPGMPPYGAYPAPGSLASEVHEPPRSRTIADLRQILGPFSGQQPPGAPAPALPAEEELALAQMLEGFHNLLRYWHHCLMALAAAGAAHPPAAAPAAVAAEPAEPRRPPEVPDGEPPAAGRTEPRSEAATARPKRSSSR